MQTTTQAEPAAAPAAPAAPQVPVTVTITGADGKTQTLQVPKTSAEVDAVVEQRRQLADQLDNVTNRRQQLAQEIGAAPAGVARTGLEDRIRVLDQRIVQLESDLASTGRQLAAAPPGMVADAEGFVNNRNSQNNGEFEEGMLVGGFFFALFAAVVYGWRRFRGRKSPKRKATPVPAESADRLERLERGMEAIAIEIERVSEGQRFVTKLLSESPTPVGVSHRIAQSEPEPVRSTAAPTL